MADAKKKTDELSDVEAAIEEIMGEQGAGGKDVDIDLTDEPAEPEVDAVAILTAERDRREAENYGGSKLARDMLPVYDALTRALDAVSDDMRGTTGGLIEGVELTMRELLNIFERHGITKVAPAVGERFDPQMHEAMFEAPVPGTRAGDIIQVMAEGFMLHDRLLRPAQVGVSSTPG